jgi:hypothetical protein
VGWEVGSGVVGRMKRLREVGLEELLGHHSPLAVWVQMYCWAVLQFALMQQYSFACTDRPGNPLAAWGSV